MPTPKAAKSSKQFEWFDGSARVRYSGHAGWSSLVARRAHNPKVVSSNLTPATMGASEENPLSALLIYSYELSRNTCQPQFAAADLFPFPSWEQIGQQQTEDEKIQREPAPRQRDF